MKCPKCKAATVVEATRMQENGSVTRTRTCYNYHSFQTSETVASVVKDKHSRFEKRGLK
jgi:transcriptional regulator NrdR family protein